FNCVAALAQAPNSQRPGSVNLRVQATYPAADLRNAALLDLIRNISEKSAGTVNLEQIAPSAAIPSYFTLDATAKGTIDAAWVSPAFFYGKDHTFALIDGTPFGPSADEYTAWRYST